MRKIVNNWHWISVFLAGAVALVAILVPMAPVTKLLLAANMVLLLHFFEEFGWPGGFPWMGMKVLMGSSEMDSSKWNCNNLSSMFGNWGFLLMVYVLPLCLPDVRFLTLAAMIGYIDIMLLHHPGDKRCEGLQGDGKVSGCREDQIPGHLLFLCQGIVRVPSSGKRQACPGAE